MRCFLRLPAFMLFVSVLNSMLLLVPFAETQSRIDLGQIPVRLELEKGFQRVEINAPSTIVVVVKSSRGATVPVVSPENVQLHYQGQVWSASIPVGQSSANFQITPHAAGIQKVEVTGASLASATGFMQCMDSKKPLMKVMVSSLPAVNTNVTHVYAGGFHVLARRELSPVTSVFGGTAAAGGQGGSPGPGPSPPPPPPPPVQTTASLKIYVQPDQVDQDPESGKWRTQIALALVGANEELIAADQDLPLHLLADKGQFNQSNVTIRKDQTSTFDNPVTLSSDQAGSDVVRVLSQMPAVEQTVVYQNPHPAKLRLEANPSSVVNDGKSPVNIVVMLQDNAKTMVNAPTETTVVLASSRGSIDPMVKIPAGQCCAQATLTAAQHGTANVTATGALLESGQTSATFLFPWMMIIMAAVGGLLGAFTHNPRAALGAHWWQVLVLGLIFGVVLTIAALFGVIGSLPKLGLPIQISQIPSGNELGALLIGFVGGFFGKKLWLKGGSEDESANEKAAAQPA